MFDEMPRLLIAEPEEEVNGDMDSIPPFDCVTRVFDPGTLVINGDLKAADMLNMHLPSLCMNNELEQPSVIATTGASFVQSFFRNGKVADHHFQSHWKSKELHSVTLDPHDENESADEEVSINFDVILDSNVMEENRCHGFGKVGVPNGAHKVFAKLHIPVLEEGPLGIESCNAAQYKLDVRHMLSSLDSNEDLSGNKDFLSPDTYCFEISVVADKSKWVFVLVTNISMFSTQALSCEKGVLGVSLSNFAFMLMPKLGFDPQVFDPGIGVHFRRDMVNQLNANEGQLRHLSSASLKHDLRGKDEIEATRKNGYEPLPHYVGKDGGKLFSQRDRNILKTDDLWLVQPLTFTFDPGGCCLFGCEKFGFNVDQ